MEMVKTENSWPRGILSMENKWGGRGKWTFVKKEGPLRKKKVGFGCRTSTPKFHQIDEGYQVPKKRSGGREGTTL